MAAVVVGSAEDERRRLAATRCSGLRPLVVEAAPDADERRCSPTRRRPWSDRCGPGAARVAGGSFISTSMIELTSGPRSWSSPGARTPPTEPLKSVSPVKTSVPLTTKLSIPSVWPGVCSDSIVRPPTSSASPGSIVAVHVHQPLGLERVGEDLDAEALLEAPWFSATWSCVVVGQQQVRRPCRPVLSIDSQQRLRRAARVDDDGRGRRARRRPGRRWRASRRCMERSMQHGAAALVSALDAGAFAPSSPCSTRVGLPERRHRRAGARRARRGGRRRRSRRRARARAAAARPTSSGCSADGDGAARADRRRCSAATRTRSR